MVNKLKVLQLVKTSNAAGWALQQMKTLIANGYDVHVAMPLGGSLVNEYKKYGVTIHSINYSLKNIWLSIKSLRTIVDEVKPDLIHSHFYISTLIMRMGLRNYNIPRVFQLPGPSHLYYPFLKRLEIALAQKNRDYWVGACQYSCDAYINAGIETGRVFLSYYSELPREDLHYDEDNKLKKEFNLPDTSILIGIISYMYPPKYYLGQTRGIKGHEDFIEAIAIASKINPDIYGLCIGGAWEGHFKYERQIHNFAKKRTDHIIFCGTRTDVPQIYHELFCAVQPSHQENLGGALQAYYYNCPIIATNTGGLPDIVIDNVTGLLVPVKSPDKLADAILKMVSDPQKAQEMLKKGQEHWNELKEKNKDSLLKIYNTILNK